jgi:hypothetical protein
MMNSGSQSHLPVDRLRRQPLIEVNSPDKGPLAHSEAKISVFSRALKTVKNMIIPDETSDTAAAIGASSGAIVRSQHGPLTDGIIVVGGGVVGYEMAKHIGKNTEIKSRKADAVDLIAQTMAEERADRRKGKARKLQDESESDSSEGTSDPRGGLSDEATFRRMKSENSRKFRANSGTRTSGPSQLQAEHSSDEMNDALEGQRRTVAQKSQNARDPPPKHTRTAVESQRQTIPDRSIVMNDETGFQISFPSVPRSLPTRMYVTQDLPPSSSRVCTILDDESLKSKGTMNSQTLSA